MHRRSIVSNRFAPAAMDLGLVINIVTKDEVKVSFSWVTAK